METYLFLGLYRDAGYFGPVERKEELHKILKDRWDNGVDIDEFETYFDLWDMTPEDFELEEKPDEKDSAFDSFFN